MNDIKAIVNDIINLHENETFKRLEALCYTLRQMKGQNYRSEHYKWRLGAKVISELKLSNHVINAITIGETMFLFVISVEVDYANPYNVQIFEDIINKIGIKREVDNERVYD